MSIFEYECLFWSVFASESLELNDRSHEFESIEAVPE